MSAGRRRVVLWMSVSLDGFIAGPGGALDWHRVDEQLHRYFNDELRTMGAFLSGRRMHELMAAYWPTADADPTSPPEIAEFAGIWREKPKIVYSRTLETTDWNTTVVREVDPAAVRALTEQPGGDLSLGGAEVAATFRRLGLVDEYRIFVHPVLVGRGVRLFGDLDETVDLRLVENRTFGNGVVMLRHERDAPAA